MPKPFIALRGDEIRSIVLEDLERILEPVALSLREKANLHAQVESQLRLDDRFKPHLTYPRGSWGLGITIDPATSRWTATVTIACDLHDPPSWSATMYGALSTQVKPVSPQVPRQVRQEPVPAALAPVGGSEPVSNAVEGEDVRPRLVVTETQAGGIETEAREFGLDRLPEPERQAILKERQQLEDRNARTIQRAKDAGLISLDSDGQMDRPNAARKAAALPVPERRKGDDGRSYDVGLGERPGDEAHGTAVETTEAAGPKSAAMEDTL